jgi:membrane protease YdiL (CAAX protease family)
LALPGHYGCAHVILDFHMIEFALAVCLILVLPALQWRKHLRKSALVEMPRGTRYVRTIATVAVLLLALTVAWWWAARPLAALGFDMPVSPRGEIGLIIAVVLIAVVVVGTWLSMRRATDEKRAMYRTKLESNDLLPRTSTEFWSFMLVALMVGAGWEVLYRGFLLWLLSPLVGVVGAVCIAALAYGLAHGYKSRRQLVGSIVSAFAFTIAFAFTHSLWWLMLLHTFLVAFGAWNGYRAFRVKDYDLAFAER